jgi:cation diffusion facilitator family transporter
MKQEASSLIFGAISNFIISVIKFLGGFLFGFNTLIADGLYTFCDFITDIMVIFGAKISNKRPTKDHPFGFGRAEYITNLFMGFFLILIGGFIFFHSFTIVAIVPSLYVLLFLGASFLLKIMIIIRMKAGFKKTKSAILLSSINEAKVDLISISCISVIVILMQFSDTIKIFKHGDMVGSIILSVMIFRMSFELIKESVLHLLGEIESDEETLKIVEDEISKTHRVTIKKIELIKYGGYYTAHLVLLMDPQMTLKKADKLENEIISHLKRMRKIKIKFVNIDLDVAL